jgi:hypothetical protein
MEEKTIIELPKKKCIDMQKKRQMDYMIKQKIYNKYKETNKETQKDNQIKYAIYNKIINNLDDTKMKERQQNHKMKEEYIKDFNNRSILEYYIIRKDTDIIYRIINNLVGRATNTLKKQKIQREITHMELIGCTPLNLKNHLQNKFTDKMNYNNYGEWEVDHIKPISIYDLTNISQLKECFNYKNLQPLNRLENQIKSNKYKFATQTLSKRVNIF